MGTKDPACHAYFQAAPPWGQYPLGRQKVPEAVPAWAALGFLQTVLGASCILSLGQPQSYYVIWRIVTAKGAPR